jgi:hypothetical protein
MRIIVLLTAEEKFEYLHAWTNYQHMSFLHSDVLNKGIESTAHSFIKNIIDIYIYTKCV